MGYIYRFYKAFDVCTFTSVQYAEGLNPIFEVGSKKLYLKKYPCLVWFECILQPNKYMGVCLLLSVLNSNYTCA